jgi:hypothetical protein
MTDTVYSLTYFAASRCLIVIDDCKDISSIQTMIFLNLFLIYTAGMSTCYSYLTTTMSLALRMGLHRSIVQGDDIIARETGRRVFWTLRLLCNSMATACGMPKCLSDEDFDQEMPLEVSDAYIEQTGISAQPDGEACPTAGSNAYIRLNVINDQVIRYIYPVKGIKRGSRRDSVSYIVSLAKVEELERELRQWKENVPMGYKLGRDEASGSRLRYAFPNCSLNYPVKPSVEHNTSFACRMHRCSCTCIARSSIT